MTPTNYDQLVAEVKLKDGVSSYNMKTLRAIHGAGKLGTTVIQNIGRELEARGLGSFPELSLNQWDDVRIYTKSSPVGRLISAIEDVGPEGDATLRSFSESPGRSATIAKLKELVAEL